MRTPEEEPPQLAAMPTSSTEEHSAGELDSSRHHQLHLTAAVRRKRTKRPRHHPPASSSSSAESTTTEEEDMAHCLILLAQGAGGGSSQSQACAAVDSKPSPSPQPPPPAMKTTERYTSRKYTEAATTADGVKAGFYVYECKTCNKCFPTFQALGGHRASHKKPRLADDEVVAVTTTTATVAKQQQQKPPPPMQIAVFPDVTTALSLSSVAAVSNKLRVHECSICGAEFASGQALGGHMRRHRPLNAPVTTKKEELGTNNLELDLNLPAPSSDEEDIPPPPPAVVLGRLGQFSDANKASGVMLTASALVDCHY